MSPASAPARLFVLFAREASLGVILRRGPSKQVRLILWHTDTDRFDPGQWLKGRLYEDRIALSPDGKLLSYFAMDLRRRRQQSEEATHAWVAVSRPPYLTALALWFAWSTHEGATTFPDNRTLLIAGVRQAATGQEAPRELHVGDLSREWDALPARGWQALNEPKEGEPDPAIAFALRGPHKYGFPHLYEKRLAEGTISLVTRRFREGMDGIDGWFLLWDRRSGTSRFLEASVANVDPAGRLILAHDGKLFAARVQPDLSVITTELADFDAMTFEEVPPPEWARQWPWEETPPKMNCKVSEHAAVFNS